MRILVLGAGKTGKLVAEVATERGHSVYVLDAKENKDAAALTMPFVTGFDVVIDFTAPEAVVQNMRACLAAGAKMVVGTTGWYDKLADMRDLAERKQAALLYGTNYSIGVQSMLQIASQMSAALKGYSFRIEETHHATKLDSPSGTAITLAEVVKKATGLGKRARRRLPRGRRSRHARAHRRERLRQALPHPRILLPARLRRGRGPRSRVAGNTRRLL